MPTLFFADLVRELAQEGGAGPLTPTGAVPGHRRFAGTVPPGTAFHYTIAGIAHPDQWEAGTGRIGNDGRLLRDTVAASSAGGSAVDFAPGLKTIALTVGAGWFAASDAYAAALAGEVAAFGSELASLTGGLAAKQPLSMLHASAAAGQATDAVTVRRGAGWVNIPLAALAFRDAGGHYALQGPLVAAAGQAVIVRRSSDGDVLDVGKDDGARLRVFASADTVGLFNVDGAGAGRDGLRIADGGVSFEVSAAEVARFEAGGLFPNDAGAKDIGWSGGGEWRHLRMAGTLSVNNIADAARGLAIAVSGATGAGQASINTTSSGYGLSFGIDGTERARLHTNGNLGIGTNAPVARMHVKSGAEIVVFETVTARGGGQCYGTFRDPAGAKGYIGYTSNNDGLDIQNSMAANIRLVTAGPSIEFHTGLTLRAAMTSVDLRPQPDNAMSIGNGAARWTTVYAATGTINTSDEREKTWRGEVDAAELRAAARIAGELGFYRWNAAVAEKGADGARLHFGVRAQAVWAIMADEGLIDPPTEGVAPSCRYAFLCYDRWDAMEPVAEVRDDEGHVLVAAQPGRGAGDRFGIRPDQLALFLIAAQEARIAALETAA